MTKVLGMLVALVALCAMPAVAFAGDNTSSGNEQNVDIDQGASGGDSSASGGDGGGDGGDGGDASSGDGGDAGNQAAVVQQNAGDDANASIDQEQNFGGGDGDNDGNGGGDNDNGDDDDNDGVGGGDDDDDNVTSGGIGGGSESVTLARTGFDAWVLALLGGLSLAGGLGLLVAQRRGRLNA